MVGTAVAGSILLGNVAPATTVTFEEMASPPATSVPLTHQIPGVTFLHDECFLAEVEVRDPALIRNSTSTPVSAATSGTAAARTPGEDQSWFEDPSFARDHPERCGSILHRRSEVDGRQGSRAPASREARGDETTS